MLEILADSLTFAFSHSVLGQVFWSGLFPVTLFAAGLLCSHLVIRFETRGTLANMREDWPACMRWFSASGVFACIHVGLWASLGLVYVPWFVDCYAVGL
jgi:hypothetical protein